MMRPARRNPSLGDHLGESRSAAKVTFSPPRVLIGRLGPIVMGLSDLKGRVAERPTPHMASAGRRSYRPAIDRRAATVGGPADRHPHLLPCAATGGRRASHCPSSPLGAAGQQSTGSRTAAPIPRCWPPSGFLMMATRAVMLSGVLLPRNAAGSPLRHLDRLRTCSMRWHCPVGRRSFPGRPPLGSGCPARQVGNGAARPFVLPLELLEPAQLITTHPTASLVPPAERNLRDLQLPDRLLHSHASTVQNRHLPQLADDLVGLVALPHHR